MDFANHEFWIALAQIIGINIVLSGDNAVVIALAARGLPPLQQKRAVEMNFANSAFWLSVGQIILKR